MIKRPADPERDLAALVADDALFDRAVAQTQADAVRLHRLLGQPLVVWREGRVVIELPRNTAGSPAGPTLQADGE